MDNQTVITARDIKEILKSLKSDEVKLSKIKRGKQIKLYE